MAVKGLVISKALSLKLNFSSHQVATQLFTRGGWTTFQTLYFQKNFLYWHIIEAVNSIIFIIIIIIIINDNAFGLVINTSE